MQSFTYWQECIASLNQTVGLELNEGSMPLDLTLTNAESKELNRRGSVHSFTSYAESLEGLDEAGQGNVDYRTAGAYGNL